MKKYHLIIITSFILINNFFFLNLQSEIINKIVVKVGGSLITSIDIQNEIVTNLVLNKQEIIQKNVDSNKRYAIKNLINKTIKKSEINKYQIKNYSKKDLQNYIENIAKNLNTNSNGLKKIFKQFNINYEVFVENHKTELLWNTLIFQIYRNQTNINIVQVDNEVEKIKENKSEKEMAKIKESILNQKKEEKLNLFSRSHFSNLENNIDINFQ
jgi:hypothetical protein